MNYYQLYPDEIDARLAKEEYWTAERVAAAFPFTRIEVPGDTSGMSIKIIPDPLDPLMGGSISILAGG